MMNVGCFQYNFVDADSGKEYRVTYANVYELKSDFSERLYEETIANTWLVRYQQTGDKSYMRSKVVPIGTWKIHDWFSNSMRSWLPVGSGIT